MILEHPQVYLIADNERIKDKINSMADSLGYAVKSFVSGVEYFNKYDKTKNSCTIVNLDPIDNPDNFIVSKLRNINTVTSPFIFVSNLPETKIVSKAFKLGAYDFLDYNDIDTLLPSKLQEGMLLDIVKKRQSIETANATELLNLLSNKEQEVLGLLVRGFCHKKIAKLLNISYRTVETHSSHIKIKTKLGISELIYIITPILR